MELQGKYGTAKVYTDEIENEAISQIINLLNQPMSKGANVRIMPDVHSGAGCVIGYTARLTDKVVPNLIGVDIGCGVTAWKLGKRSELGEKYEKLDKFIRENIPSGRTIRESGSWEEPLEHIYDTYGHDYIGHFLEMVEIVCDKTKQDFEYVYNSLGTLGGGNHFIEIDLDNKDNLWLVIHSGSRNFGLKVAKHHQHVAEESMYSMPKEEFDRRVEEIKRTKKGKGIEVAINALRKEARSKGKATGLEYLEGENTQSYYEDMNIAQEYAGLNRRLMGYLILEKFFKLDYDEVEIVESVHNYINFEDRILRKGAISAHKGARVIIPLNMADGIIVGFGRGNSDWNWSAPHGAGRKMSRSKAKASLSVEEFQRVMKKKGVWSSTADKNTLDEAPMAYKKSEKIIEYLADTVDIEVHMKPTYNFKAAE